MAGCVLESFASIVPAEGSPDEALVSSLPPLPNVPSLLENRGVSDETTLPDQHQAIEAEIPQPKVTEATPPDPSEPENEDEIPQKRTNTWISWIQNDEVPRKRTSTWVSWVQSEEGESPRTSISAVSMLVRQRTSELAQKSWKGTWWFIRWVCLHEIALRQIPMAYVVTIPALMAEFILSMFPHAFCDLEKILGLDGKAPRSRRCKWIS